MKNILRKVWNFFGLLFKSIVSCVLMLLFSKFSVARQTKKQRLKEPSGSKVNVLGNGPSLKKALEDGDVDTSIDCMALNLFLTSEWFWKLKPKYYYLADDGFWSPKTERGKQNADQLIDGLNRIDWQMELCIPTQKNIKKLVAQIHNENVTVTRMNTIEVDGFKSFRNWAYRNYLGAPRCQTVLNMALVSAINKGYETVYLYGADHSWTRDLFVDDNNVVCYGDRHVYNTGLTVIKKTQTIGFLLHAFADMFDSHWIINDYAKSMGVIIYNCTKDSFVDAYERKYE